MGKNSSAYKDHPSNLCNFQDVFCIRPRTDIIEFGDRWSTGQPFYRTKNDLNSPVSFDAPGKRLESKGELALVSFPLEFIPLDRSIAERHNQMGIGVNWCGAGNSTPSEVQMTLSAH